MARPKKCPECRASEARLKFFIRHGRDGNNRVIWSRASAALPGFRKCNNTFHGVGGWVRGA